MSRIWNYITGKEIRGENFGTGSLREELIKAWETIYKKDRLCKKCGAGYIKDEHVHKYTIGLWTGEPPDNAKVPEHIERTCKNCGYSWKERPLNIEGYKIDARTASNPFVKNGCLEILTFNKIGIYRDGPDGDALVSVKGAGFLTGNGKDYILTLTERKPQ